MFSIGDLSRRASVKVPTIRYYEDVGLLAPAERSEGNQRRFGREELDRLIFIRHARDLGFSLGAIRDLLDLSGHPDSPCHAADEIAAEQLSAVRQRIGRLRRLERELVRMTRQCAGHTVSECDVLRSLADHELCAEDH